MFLIRLFIKDAGNLPLPLVRKKYAVVCSGISICLNIILCAGKLLAGMASGSMAIVADGFNNLADVGAASFAMFGFLFAGIGASEKHPFGHGRIEWLVGLFTSVAVIYMGIELIKISWEAIVAPNTVIFDIKIFIVLCFSILIKIYMYYYNKKIGEKIDSSALQAMATDSCSDAIATAGVLLSMAVSQFTSVRAADGACGIMVAFFIIYAGYKTFIETMNRMIGVSPNPGVMEKIGELAKQYPLIIGMYNPIIHDYGMGKMSVSLHIEADSATSADDFQVVAEKFAYDLYENFGCHCTVQMNFVERKTRDAQQIYAGLLRLLQNINAEIEIDKFCVLKNKSYKSVVLDILMPVQNRKLEGKVLDEVKGFIQCFSTDYRVLPRIIFKKRKFS